MKLPKFLWPFGGGARADASGDRSPYGNFWFEPLGMRTSTGVRVTPNTAMRLGAVYSCVRVIAESFASLPFEMYERASSGDRKPVTDHWLVRLMRRPNKFQTGFEWKEMMAGHLALRGNAFNRMVPDGSGGIGELWPIHPDSITIVPAGDAYAFKVSRPDGSSYVLGREEVWHLKGLSFDGIAGLNPIEQAAEVMGIAIAGQGFVGRFFANNAQPGGWIEYDGKFADNKAKVAFREQWQKLQGGANRGKTAVLEKGMKYNQLTINNSDAQFLEVMQHTRSEIAGMFRVPPHMIGDLDRATFSNIEQQSMDFINGCLLPMSERWESSLEVNLLLDDEADKFELEFGFANLLRGDSKARQEFYTGMINNGSMTRNEARRSEGWNGLPGLDEPLVQGAMVKASAMPDKAAALPAPGAPGKPPAGPEPAPVPTPAPTPAPKKKAESDQPDYAARLQAMATSAAERLARREAKDFAALLAKPETTAETLQLAFAKQCAVVISALGVSIEAANAYVAARQLDSIRSGHEEEDILAAALPKLTALALKGEL